jgi:hypothetical protein
MKYAFVIVGVVALLLGLAMAAMAKSAIHEIEAGIAFLIFAVMIGSAGVMGALDRLREEQTPLLRIIEGGSSGLGLSRVPHPESYQHGGMWEVRAPNRLTQENGR